jgi:hypothetical protein
MGKAAASKPKNLRRAEIQAAVMQTKAEWDRIIRNVLLPALNRFADKYEMVLEYALDEMNERVLRTALSYYLDQAERNGLDPDTWLPITSTPPCLRDLCDCKTLHSGQHIDHINNRVYQLHSLFGVVRSMGGTAGLQEVGMAPNDMAGLAWLADDLLEEVEEHADKLHEHFTKGQASCPECMGRTQPRPAAA